MSTILGRLVQSEIAQFSFAAFTSTFPKVRFGELVHAQITPDLELFGIIADIRWLPDDMVDQIARAEQINEVVLADNKANRNLTPVIHVLNLGYRGDRLCQTLPPQPASSLEEITTCSEEEVVEFTDTSLAYLRLILQESDTYRIFDLLAAHLQQARDCHQKCGSKGWLDRVLDRLVELMLDDYQAMIALMESIHERIPINEEIKEIV